MGAFRPNWRRFLVFDSSCHIKSNEKELQKRFLGLVFHNGLHIRVYYNCTVVDPFEIKQYYFFLSARNGMVFFKRLKKRIENREKTKITPEILG